MRLSRSIRCLSSEHCSNEFKRKKSEILLNLEEAVPNITVVIERLKGLAAFLDHGDRMNLTSPAHGVYAVIAVLLVVGCGADESAAPWEVDDDADIQNRSEPDAPVDEPDEERRPEPMDELPDDGNEAWAGLWRVDQPSHATYEGTVYDFQADGTLIEVETLLLGSHPNAEPDEVGFVSRCNREEPRPGDPESTDCVDWNPTCTFGDAWSAPDQDTLLIQGDCNDGQPRIIELRFDEDRFFPREIIVEDEAWEHNWFAWQWTRCESTDCLLF